MTSYSFDRFEDIRDLLRSVAEQTKKNSEVVYVTERDMRLYEAVKREIQDLGVRAKVIHNDGRLGLAEARNLGASIALGDIIAFVDDDVVLDKRWSEAVERAFESFSDVVAITGPAYPFWVGESADWLPVELDWLIGCTRWFKSDRPVEVRNCWGMNMAFRRSVFLKIGGFSYRTGYHRGEMAEDVEISMRIRQALAGKIVYVPSMNVRNKVHPYRLRNRFIIDRSAWISHSRRAIRTRNRAGLIWERSILFSLFMGFLSGKYLRRVRSFHMFLELSRVVILSISIVGLGYVFDLGSY